MMNTKQFRNARPNALFCVSAGFTALVGRKVRANNSRAGVGSRGGGVGTIRAGGKGAGRRARESAYKVCIQRAVPVSGPRSARRGRVDVCSNKAAGAAAGSGWRRQAAAE